MSFGAPQAEMDVFEGLALGSGSCAAFTVSCLECCTTISRSTGHTNYAFHDTEALITVAFAWQEHVSFGHWVVGCDVCHLRSTAILSVGGASLCDLSISTDT